MNSFTKLYLLAFCCIILSAQVVIGQTLVWGDEFNYTGLPDATKWGNEVGYIRNNELQYYTDRNINNQVVRNGNLEITALKENFMGYAYTSASINTKGKYSVKYGKLEARMKLPMGQGLWPAFWTLGINIDQVSWPACGEIDIMEHINKETLSYGTAHWAGANGGKYTKSGSSITVADPTQFHLYTIIWDSLNIKWFVDNVQFHQLNITGGVNGTSEFHLPHVLNLLQENLKII